jgi:sulfur-oxidizing protein SoxY
MQRRQWLGAAVVVCASPVARADAVPSLAAQQAALQAATDAFVAGAGQGARLREAQGDAGVQLSISPLVENGNTVPVTVQVQGAAAGSVRRLAVLTERNPQPEVAVFTLGPLAGSAQASTRLRLATSQTVVALAHMADGTVWQRRVSVVVTLAACVEGG